MKLSSALRRVAPIALLSVLTLSGNPKALSSGETSRPGGAHGTPEEGIPNNSKKLKIILHGLMVGRYWNMSDEDKRFEVGIVAGAKNHNHFTLTYYDGKNKKCEAIDVQDRRLVCEVQKDSKPCARNIEMWHAQSRKDSKKDSSLILNMEGDRLYNDVPRHGTFLRGKHFRPVFQFNNGQVKTHTPTLHLLAKKPGAPCVYIGPIAEVVVVEVEIKAGEELVLRPSTNAKPWRRTYDEVNPDDEVRILNLDQVYNDCSKPYDGTSHCRSDSYTELPVDYFSHPQGFTQPDCEEFPPTDFQLYYNRVFKRSKRDQFRLSCPKCRKCGQVKDGITPLTVPPYRCGMVLVSSAEIK